MKNIFLFGAGFSYQFGMPLVKDLTEVFYSFFNEQTIPLMIEEISKTSPFGSDRPLNKEAIEKAFNILLDYMAKKPPESNYEKILGDINNLKKLQYNVSDNDSYSIVYMLLYKIINDILSKYNEIAFDLYLINKEPYSLFKELISKDTETWVFTLNHDLFFEYLAIDNNIPITLGDKHTDILRKDNRSGFNTLINFTYSNTSDISINNENYFKNKYGVNLVKLHGGLSEIKLKDDQCVYNLDINVKSSSELNENFNNFREMKHLDMYGKKTSSLSDWAITTLDNKLDLATHAMLTGNDKYSKTLSPKTGEEKIALFYDAISCADLLTIIGYGFGDNHINSRILVALARNDNLKLKIVSPKQEVPEFLEVFNENKRITIIQSDVANWLYYEKMNKWSKHLLDIDYIKQTDKVRESINIKMQSLFNLKF